ncbi:hypothetical protein [Streptomyces sp. NPDC088748]|uniref:hypothetical protein n=1 Tax=Streptomyces sp. NPDC088748 TaxID=3365887 RepID=UPI0037F71706
MSVLAVQLLAVILVLGGGAGVLAEWGAAHFRTAFMYMGFTAVVGGGLLIFPGEAVHVLAALVV